MTITLVRIALLAALIVAPVRSIAAEPMGFFQVEGRRAALASGKLPESRAACLAIERDPAWSALPPVTRIRTAETEDSDGIAQRFTWAVMVLSARAVAGDVDSESDLRTLLSRWSESNALRDIEPSAAARYALERVLLPVISAYAVIDGSLSNDERYAQRRWIDGLIGQIKHPGEANTDSHQALRGSVLASWGIVSGNEGLYADGLSDLQQTLSLMREDGSLPLESRRGAEAALRTQQTLASLFLIAEASVARGSDTYASTSSLGNDIRRGLAYLTNIVVEPGLALPYAAENHQPGAQGDFSKQDLDFLRSNRSERDHLAFLAIVRARLSDSLSYSRLLAAIPPVSDVAPRIDEFLGGNTACFWGIT